MELLPSSLCSCSCSSSCSRMVMMEAKLTGHGSSAFSKSFPLSFKRFHYNSVSFPPYSTGFVALASKRSPKRLKYSAPRFSKDGGLLYVEVAPSGEDSWKLESVIEQLRKGAVGVIPTDTVYAIVCDMNSHSAIERLRRIKDIDTSKPLSILCRSFHDIDVYTMGFPRGDSLGHPNIFRAVKHCLPGPYTFILSASKALPKQCINFGTSNAKYAARKSVGVRIPDDVICRSILEKLDSPLVSTSVKSPKEDDWIIDPVVITDVYGPEGLDFVVDAGVRVAEPSTVVDMTGSVPKIIRQGKGPRQPWMMGPEDNEDVQIRGDKLMSGTS